MDKKEIEVVAAVIVKDNALLATQRGYGEFKGKWEFPGGKIEKGESKEKALVREIKEELNADITIIDCLDSIEYTYPDFKLKMHSYICNLKSGIDFVYHDKDSLEHENMIWLDFNDIEHLDWLPADLLVIEDLKKIYRLKR